MISLHGLDGSNQFQAEMAQKSCQVLCDTPTKPLFWALWDTLIMFRSAHIIPTSPPGSPNTAGNDREERVGLSSLPFFSSPRL